MLNINNDIKSPDLNDDVFYEISSAEHPVLLNNISKKILKNLVEYFRVFIKGSDAYFLHGELIDIDLLIVSREPFSDIELIKSNFKKAIINHAPPDYDIFQIDENNFMVIKLFIHNYNLPFDIQIKPYIPSSEIYSMMNNFKINICSFFREVKIKDADIYSDKVIVLKEVFDNIRSLKISFLKNNTQDRWKPDCISFFIKTYAKFYFDIKNNTLFFDEDTYVYLEKIKNISILLELENEKKNSLIHGLSIILTHMFHHRAEVFIEIFHEINISRIFFNKITLDIYKTIYFSDFKSVLLKNKQYFIASNLYLCFLLIPNILIGKICYSDLKELQENLPELNDDIQKHNSSVFFYAILYMFKQNFFKNINYNKIPYMVDREILLAAKNLAPPPKTEYKNDHYIEISNIFKECNFYTEGLIFAPDENMKFSELFPSYDFKKFKFVYTPTSAEESYYLVGNFNNWLRTSSLSSSLDPGKIAPLPGDERWLMKRDDLHQNTLSCEFVLDISGKNMEYFECKIVKYSNDQVIEWIPTHTNIRFNPSLPPDLKSNSIVVHI